MRLTDLQLKKRFFVYANECLEGGLIVSDKDKASFTKIFEVFEEGKIGIIIYGNTGTGKTLIFELLRRVINPKDSQYFLIRNTLDIVLNFNIEGHASFRHHDKFNMMYDDLGNENKGVFYGDDVDVFEKLIQFRYDLYRSKQLRTFFTTNLTQDELQEKYGPRVWSRLKEMCSHVILDDGDKRTLRNFKKFLSINHHIKSDDDIEWEKRYELYKQKSSEIENLKQGLGARTKKKFNN